MKLTCLKTKNEPSDDNNRNEKIENCKNTHSMQMSLSCTITIKFSAMFLVSSPSLIE